MLELDDIYNEINKLKEEFSDMKDELENIRVCLINMVKKNDPEVYYDVLEKMKGVKN